MPKATHSNGDSLNELQMYLRQNRSVNNCTMTHTSMGRPMGSYYIKPSEYINFMDLYHKTVFEKKMTAYLVETLKDEIGDNLVYQPLKIDLDFRYFSDKCKRIYILDQIKDICKKYMEIIEQYLEELDDEERIFYILEKPSPTIDTDKHGNNKVNTDGLLRIKDGIHIMAPGVVVNEYLQLKFRDYVYKSCADIFDKYSPNGSYSDYYNFDEPYSEIFDRKVITSNGWMMYGSTKPNQPPYVVTYCWKVYSDKCEEVVNIPSSKELVQILSIRNKYDISMIKLEKQDEVDNSESEHRKTKKRTISGKKRKKCETKSSVRDIKLIIDYVNCLDKRRAKSYHTWMDVGWCLHNLHNKDDKLLQVWINFSKKAEEYQHVAEIDCKEKWDEMHDEGLGIASLKLWAKEDNPEEYHKICSRDTWKSIMEACKNGKGSSYDVAVVMLAMYKDYYKCISIKDTKWFFYDKSINRWVLDDKGIRLKEKICTDVYREFKNKGGAENDKSEEADDIHAQNRDKIFKVMNRLKETAFKANIMTECAELFYDKDRSFLDKLDANNQLLGFKNGVYDLTREEFRKGRPEDYISKSTNIDYIAYDESNNEIQEIMKFYKDIFVLENIRNYVLKRSASFLSGSTRDESFDIYSGKGGNGKSKHMELMENAFGDYAVKLPIQLLTAKRSASNAATPELARTKGARLCSMQEPDTDTKLNVGLMKELTGGDKIQARALYGDPIEFKPQFKMVLCCNDKPKLPPHDEGTWRRVRNTEFISKFTYMTDIHEDNVLDFKIDTDLSERFESWSEAFMAILLNYHKIYRRENLAIPDEIMEYTDEYRENNNQLQDFIDTHIDYDSNSSNSTGVGAIYKVYKEWWLGFNANKKGIKTIKELQFYLDDKFGKYYSCGVQSKDKGYKGVTIKNLLQCDIIDETDDLDR